MKTIQEYFNFRCKVCSDINEHLPTLKQYGEKCDHITEFGLRGGESTSAFLASKPKKLITYDIINYKNTLNIFTPLIDRNTEFIFKHADSTKIKIEETDLLFIDTLHTYEQLKLEFKHTDMVKKYIILHDTEIFGIIGQNGEKGLISAITEFLQSTTKWKMHHCYTNNNGLIILKASIINV
jgi:hypothetical protein